MYYFISSVIRQKGESQNVINNVIKHAKFSEKQSEAKNLTCFSSLLLLSRDSSFGLFYKSRSTASIYIKV